MASNPAREKGGGEGKRRQDSQVSDNGGRMKKEKKKGKGKGGGEGEKSAVDRLQ